jgi:hypothetical protein
MILLDGYRQAPLPVVTARRFAAYRNRRYKTAELESELLQIEQDIEDFADRTRELAEELGARYAVFRCIGQRYDDGRDTQNNDIMTLSRETDEYIRTIYNLEQRRRELLDEIGK